MSWLLAKLSGKTDNILSENSITPTPALYPSIPQPETQPTPPLPYAIQPTPTPPSYHTDNSNVLPHSLDAMKVKFKFLYDSNIEDLEMNQIMTLVNKSKQSSRQLEQFISEIENINFELEKSVISST